MKRKILPIVLAGIVILALACVLFFRSFTFVGFRLYSRSVPVLDFLGEGLTSEKYDKLHKKLPDCLILWDVPFQGELVSSNVSELTVTHLTDEDVQQMDYFVNLSQVNAESCVDYPQLLELQRRKPQCQVDYLVWMDGVCYPQDTKTADLQHFAALDCENVQWLPQLESLSVGACDDYQLLRNLVLDRPDLSLTYTVDFGETSVPADAQQVHLTGVGEEKLLNAVPALLDLKELDLLNCAISQEGIDKLKQMMPELDIRFRIELGGQIFQTDVTQIALESTELQSIEDLRSALQSLPNLERVQLVDCTIQGAPIDNEELASLREEFRDRFKLVWQVYCGKVPAMTDDTWFMPIKKGEYYFKQSHAYNLRYCEDMVCIDLGHSRIENVDFAAFMPHLKYLIITESAVQDISGISNCKELIYFENDFTIIRDLSPLLGCTALEDLNLETPGYLADMTPVYQMKWLKNLFIAKSPSRVIRAAQEALPDTRVDYHGLGAKSGQGWRNLPNYYAMRDFLGMPYMA